MLDGLTQWLDVGPVTEELGATKDLDAWEEKITVTREQGGQLIDSITIANLILLFDFRAAILVTFL